MSTTLLVLEQEIAKVLGYASGTCSAAGTTTTIVDTSGDSPLDPDDRDSLYRNMWARIDADSAGTPLNVGEVRRVSGYSPAASTLTLSRAFSNATTTTQTYGLYPVLPPDRQGTLDGIKELINDVLRAGRHRQWSLLTLATDGDMETSGVTNWTALSAAAFAKGVTASTGARLGKQGLQSIQSSGTDGVKMATALPVAAGEVYDLVVDLLATTGTHELVAYDVTNAAEIDSVSTTLRGEQQLHVQVTIPSGCRQLNAYLRTTSTGVVTNYWDNLSIRHVTMHTMSTMSLPSWFSHDSQFEALWAVGGGSALSGSDGARLDDRNWWRVNSAWVEEDHGGATPFRVCWESAIPNGYHLAAQVLRPYVELSALTDTSDADKDWVRAWVLARIYGSKEHFDEKQAARWLAEARALDKNQPRWQGRAFPAIRGF